MQTPEFQIFAPSAAPANVPPRGAPPPPHLPLPAATDDPDVINLIEVMAVRRLQT